MQNKRNVQLLIQSTINNLKNKIKQVNNNSWTETETESERGTKITGCRRVSERERRVTGSDHAREKASPSPVRTEGVVAVDGAMVAEELRRHFGRYI
ncbi:hypothetical protein TSUD_20470 [Trifolium subterraneum]|uniref:Uncharacterized protein n=1 Tax=Trifolium subterraneum TaxID=3900 RepID=A0A2Z6NDA8_TRISU|nr:hypothetical protein TSUD_20470 [Trifolium subterraneum]